ncbi:MAG: hypothetical protein ACRDZ6_05270 [Acidimicrobiales bacterium]
MTADPSAGGAKLHLATDPAGRAPTPPGSFGSDQRGAETSVLDREMPAGADLLVLDSCHSTWLFDVATKRFRRILKGLDVDPALAATDWRNYERLELSEGSEAFAVVLNPAGTRRIRSWRHAEGCEQCGGEQTAELSLEDIRRFAHV